MNSSAHLPALRIKAGDHVITSTIDAGGTDAAGVRRGQGPNPEIGPFFVEGSSVAGRASVLETGAPFVAGA